APGHCRGPEASRGRDWRLRGAAHVGPTTAPSPPPALCLARGGLDARWCPVGAVSAPLLPARPRPLPAFSALVPGGARAALWPAPVLLDGALSEVGRAPALAAPPRRLARPGVGRLRERAPPGSSARPQILILHAALDETFFCACLRFGNK